MSYKRGDVIGINDNKYVVLEAIAVANNQYNYALAASHHFQHPKLFDPEFQHWLVFYMTDNEISRNKGTEPLGNLLKPN